MIEDNQKRLNQLHVVIDGLIVMVSYLLAYWLVFILGDRTPAYSAEFYFLHLVAVVPGCLILYWMNQLYTPKRVMAGSFGRGLFLPRHLTFLPAFLFSHLR